MSRAERTIIMFNFKSVFTGNNGSAVNGNGYAGLDELSADILSGGHGVAVLNEKDRRAHQQLAEKKRRLDTTLSSVSTAKAQGEVDEALSEVGSLITQIEQESQGTAKTLCDVLGPEVKNSSAPFRVFCKNKGLFRPVAEPEPMPNIAALFAVFFCGETAANTSILFSGGLFSSIEDAAFFSAALAAVNLGLSGVFGFVTLRNWRHTSTKVRGLARWSVVPLALAWVTLNGGAVLLRLSQSVNLREWNFQDLELMDVYASLVLLLIAGLTSIICVGKSYKCVADPDAEFEDMHRRCMGQPKAAIENTANAGQDNLDTWMKEANDHVKKSWATVDAVESALNAGKAAAENGAKELMAFAEDLKKQFTVEQAKVSTTNTFSWVQSGPTVAGLEFAAHETAIIWDHAKEAEVRAFVQRSRDRLTEVRKDVANAYAEGSARIRTGRAYIAKYQHFSPEVTT